MLRRSQTHPGTIPPASHPLEGYRLTVDATVFRVNARKCGTKSSKNLIICIQVYFPSIFVYVLKLQVCCMISDFITAGILEKNSPITLLFTDMPPLFLEQL